MSASIRQESPPQNWLSAGGTTTTTNAFGSAALVGSLIEMWILWNTAVTLPSSVQDSAGQNYTFQYSAFDSNDGLTLALYTFANNQSNTTLTVTSTWATTKGYTACWAKEITGLTTNPYQTAIGQDQVSPGATTGAITSTNITPTGAPCLLSALSFDDGGNLASSVAGSLILGQTGWNLDGIGAANTTTSASQRLTTTTPIAATFTNVSDGGTRRFLTICATYTESGIATTITPSAGSATVTGNQPNSYSATNTVIQTFVARRESGILEPDRRVVAPPARKIFLPSRRKAA